MESEEFSEDELRRMLIGICLSIGKDSNGWYKYSITDTVEYTSIKALRYVNTKPWVYDSIYTSRIPDFRTRYKDMLMHIGQLKYPDFPYDPNDTWIYTMKSEAATLLNFDSLSELAIKLALRGYDITTD